MRLVQNRLSKSLSFSINWKRWPFESYNFFFCSESHGVTLMASYLFSLVAALFVQGYCHPDTTMTCFAYLESKDCTGTNSTYSIRLGANPCYQFQNHPGQSSRESSCFSYGGVTYISTFVWMSSPTCSFDSPGGDVWNGKTKECLVVTRNDNSLVYSVFCENVECP
jgi:hypothetical protein